MTATTSPETDTVLDELHAKLLKSKPKFEVVKLASIKVDPNYQRAISTQRVNEMADAWDMSAAATISVSERASGGGRWLVDGQHRVAAAQLAGVQELPALVYRGLTAQEEAALRLKLNRSMAEKPQERFRAQLIAGMDESVQIQRILDKHGTKINESPSLTGGINSVSAVESIYRVDKGNMLDRVVGIYSRVYGTVEAQNTTSGDLRGLAWFLLQHDFETTEDNLVERLKEVGHGAFRKMAKSYTATFGGSGWINTYRALVEIYNRKRPEKSRLKFKVGGWSTRGLGSGSGFGGDSWE